MSFFDRTRFKRKAFRILGFLTLVGLILPSAVMWLWNLALAPAVEMVNPVNFWQAAGLLILSRILFGGNRFRPGGSFRSRSHFWREKWKKMPDEDRAKFREEWKKRCGPMGN